MKKNTAPKPGFVYIFVNPLFPNWVKIGMTEKDDWSKRLKNYEQYVPERYEPVATLKTSDAKGMESVIHNTLKVKYGKEKKSREFFCIDAATALNVLRNLAVECKQIQGLSEYVDGHVSAVYDADGKRHSTPIDKLRGVKFRALKRDTSIYMTFRNGEYVVLKGSKFDAMTDSLRTSEVKPIASIRAERESLERDPTRCKDGVLLVDVPFKSSSRALAVMRGTSSAQGPQCWVDEEGRALAEYI